MSGVLCFFQPIRVSVAVDRKRMLFKATVFVGGLDPQVSQDELQYVVLSIPFFLINVFCNLVDFFRQLDR